MVSHARVHEDDEPLLPLMDHDSGRTRISQKQHDPLVQDDIVKTSKLSGSTAHDSISTASSGQEDSECRNHHHRRHSLHSHAHKDLAKRRSVSMESDRGHGPSLSDDDEPILLEAQKEAERDKRRLKIAIGLCSTFFVVELVGGLWSDSLALLSDSFHLLTDITSFIISLAAIYLSHRPSTATHTFGYHRAEVLGALFSIFLIWALTLLLVIEAFDRVRHPIDVDGKTMSVVAGLGVFVNICLMFVLGGHHHHHGDDHEHGNGHGHGHTHQEHAPLQIDDDLDHDQTHKPVPLHDHDAEHGHSGHKHRHHHINLNITAATLHVLGDLLSSIGVLISSLVITFYPSLTFLDPVCTFIFSILVIATTVGIFKRSLSILMERVPSGMDSEEIKEVICDIPGVLEVKALHIWSLTLGQTVLAGTLYLQPEIKDLRKATAIITAARRMIRRRYGIRECTLQVELYSPHTHRRQETFQSNGACSSTTLQHPVDALARHDQDIIFSIGDEDLDEIVTPHSRYDGHGHSHLLSQQIMRAGTPLNQYRDNRHATDDDDDDSETEMEQEVPLRADPNRWT